MPGGEVEKQRVDALLFQQNAIFFWQYFVGLFALLYHLARRLKGVIVKL